MSTAQKHNRQNFEHNRPGPIHRHDKGGATGGADHTTFHGDSQISRYSNRTIDILIGQPTKFIHSNRTVYACSMRISTLKTAKLGHTIKKELKIKGLVVINY